MPLFSCSLAANLCAHTAAALPMKTWISASTLAPLQTVPFLTLNQATMPSCTMFVVYYMMGCGMYENELCCIAPDCWPYVKFTCGPFKRKVSITPDVDHRITSTASVLYCSETAFWNSFNHKALLYGLSKGIVFKLMQFQWHMDAGFALAVEFYKGLLGRIPLKPEEEKLNTQSNLGPTLFDRGFCIH